MGHSPSCHPRNPRPECLLPNYAGFASGSSTLREKDLRRHLRRFRPTWRRSVEWEGSL
jgi:hypothetical protein